MWISHVLKCFLCHLISIFWPPPGFLKWMALCMVWLTTEHNDSRLWKGKLLTLVDEQDVAIKDSTQLHDYLYVCILYFDLSELMCVKTLGLNIFEKPHEFVNLPTCCIFGQQWFDLNCNLRLCHNFVWKLYYDKVREWGYRNGDRGNIPHPTPSISPK